MTDVEVDGRRVFVHTGGGRIDPSRMLVVLVHGAGGDHTVWRYQTRWLASSGRSAAAVDLPGHGRSEGPPIDTVGGMAEWVCAVIDRLGAGPGVVVAGHSMGALVAVEVALRRAVSGIALLAPSVRMLVHPDLQAAADRMDPLAADLIVGWTHTGRARFGPHRDPGVWKQGSNRRLLEANAASLGTDLRACSSWEAPAPGAVTIPVLALLGSADVMTPAASGMELVERMPAARVTVVPDASHAMLYERPSEVNRALDSWLDGLGGDRPDHGDGGAWKD